MNRRVLWVVMLLCALVLALPKAWAQRPPDTDPPTGVITQDIVMSWDRSAVPGEIVLLPEKTLLGFNTDQSKGYGRLHMTCRSESDSAAGRCPTVGSEITGATVTEVALSFAERRSGMRTDVRIIGALKRAFDDYQCYLDYWDEISRAISTTYSPVCVKDSANGTGVSLSIPASELSRLVAGRWKAQLILDVRQGAGSTALGSYVFNLDFTITDYDAISIYFPEFDSIAPLVNMNLRYDPIRQVVAGRKELQMCLYDGLGSQSEFLGVTVRDSGPRPPIGSDFAVWHSDGGSDDSQRLDYQVGLNYGGNRLAMKHGVEQLLHGIDSAQLRLVLLPGMSQPVYCVPTPLTLETPPTPIASKRPGRYDGELTVELRVPTAKP